jgi:hypothetical protein
MPGFLAGPLSSWTRSFERAHAMGFRQICTAPVSQPGRRGDLFLTADFDKPDPRMGLYDSTAALITDLSASAARFGLETLVDVVLDRIAVDGADGRTHEAPSRSAGTVDPRTKSADVDAAFARFDDREASSALLTQWCERLSSWRQSGAAGFRLLGLERVPPEFLAALVEAVDGSFFAWTPGLDWERLERLTGMGLDGVFASTPWWDGRASWYAEEHELLQRVAPIIAPVEVPFGPRLAHRIGSDETRRLLYSQVLQIAAATSDGLFVPMGFESLAQQPLEARFSTGVPDGDAALAGDIAKAIASIGGGAMRSLTGANSKVTALEMTARRTLVLINTDLTYGHPSPLPLERDDGELPAGEVRVMQQPARPPIVIKRPPALAKFAQGVAGDRRGHLAASRRRPVRSQADRRPDRHGRGRRLYRRPRCARRRAAVEGGRRGGMAVHADDFSRQCALAGELHALPGRSIPLHRRSLARRIRYAVPRHPAEAGGRRRHLRRARRDAPGPRGRDRPQILHAHHALGHAGDPAARRRRRQACGP